MECGTNDLGGVINDYNNSIFSWILGLLILYVVILLAVKHGINQFVAGRFIEGKYGVETNEKSFLDRDLDNDK